MKAQFICFLFALGMIVSCDDEKDVTTDCERTTSAIKEYVDTQNLKTVNLFQGDVFWDLHASFVIEDSFINIDGTRYNLCFLKRYTRDNNNLILYF